MNGISAVMKRELASYFATPIAYVFIVIFLFAMGAFTFYVGRFYDNGIADLSVFFGYHPWLYLFLVPAIGMRLWADERLSWSQIAERVCGDRRYKSTVQVWLRPATVAGNGDIPR